MNMRKLILVALATLALSGASVAQQEIQNMGKAPNAPNSIGRLDARIFDAAGQPVKDARVLLESARTDGYFCEAWNSTDERGVAVLPPLHMGRLKLIVKARGYETQTLTVSAESLNEPVRVTLVKK